MTKSLSTTHVETESPHCLIRSVKEPPVALAVSVPTREDDGKKNKGETILPTPSSLDSSITSFRSSTSSSPSISPSSSITTDTSVMSDTHRGDLGSDKDSHEEHKVSNREISPNNDTIVVPVLNAGTDADVKHIESAPNIIASTSKSAPSTPASSSTSLPPPIPTPPSSLSAPASTSPSTATVQDSSIDFNGLTSLLRTRAQVNQNLNVKFAPLPEMAPRKRKSTIPLGMAARSQLARRRRMMYQDAYDSDGMGEDHYQPRRFYVSGMAEEEEEMGADDRGKKCKKRKDGEEGEKKEKKAKKKDGEQLEEEDPLAALAKKMGRAGKHLWRKMAAGGKTEKENSGDDVKLNTKAEVVDVPVIPGDTERQGENGGEPGETRDPIVEEPIELEVALQPPASIPLPQSSPQSPTETDDSPRSDLSLTSENASEMGAAQGDSVVIGNLKCLPPTPSIIVSAA